MFFICIFPQGPGSAAFLPQKPYNDIPDMYEDSLSFQVIFH